MNPCPVKQKTTSFDFCVNWYGNLHLLQGSLLGRSRQNSRHRRGQDLRKHWGLFGTLSHMTILRELCQLLSVGSILWLWVTLRSILHSDSSCPVGMSKIWETGLPRSSYGPVAVHRCVKSCCRILHHLLTMAMQISLSQQHRQVLVECDVLQEVKHSLPRRIMWEYLDEGGVDVASLLEQGLVAPMRVQPAQLPRHSVVLPTTSYCSLSSGSQS